MCKGTANYRRDKQPNAVDCEQHTNADWGYQEEEFLEDMYLYQLQRGKSQTPVVAIHINGIPISLHLDTQADVTVVTEKHYGKLRTKCPLQQTSMAIRSHSGEGKSPVLPLLGKFTAALVQGEKETYVVKGQGDTALLSRGAAEHMSLVEYHLDLTTNSLLPVGGNATRDH